MPLAVENCINNYCAAAALATVLQEESIHHLINELFMWIFPNCLAFVRENCRELVTTSNSNLAVCYMRVIDCMLQQVVEVGEFILQLQKKKL